MEQSAKQYSVSVVVTSFNREKFIINALDSMWAQDYRPLELVIIDDGSRKTTRDLIEEWISSHSGDPLFRIKYEPLPQNRGLGYSKCRGYELATGDFIQSLDDDDWFPPTFISSKIKVAESDPEIALVVSGGSLYSHDGCFLRDVKLSPMKPRESSAVYCLRQPLSTGNIMIRRSLYLNIGGYHQARVPAEDLDLVGRIGARNVRIGIDESSAICWRLHAGERMSAENKRGRFFWGRFYGRLWAEYRKNDMINPETRAQFELKITQAACHSLRNNKNADALLCMDLLWKFELALPWRYRLYRRWRCPRFMCELEKIHYFWSIRCAMRWRKLYASDAKTPSPFHCQEADGKTNNRGVKEPATR